MPIVLDNPEETDAIARLVFDGNLFTAFYRTPPCDTSGEANGVCNAFKRDSFLLSLEPEPVFNNLHPLHYQFVLLSRDLVHIHVGFKTSIENMPAIRSILTSLHELDIAAKAGWRSEKMKYENLLKVTMCNDNYFSNADHLLGIANNILNPLPRLAAHRECLWNQGNDNQPSQLINCDLIPANTLSEEQIRHLLVNTISQAVPEPASQEVPEISATTATEPDSIQIMLALMIIFYMLRRLIRPISNLALRNC